MITLLQCEYKKTRKCYIFLMALAITAAQLFWVLQGNYTDTFLLENGFLMFLYQLPLANAIFLPLLTIVVSSRLCDIEHKGNMFKQLSVITEKGTLYDSKFIYGLVIVLFCVLINWGTTILFGYINGFSGNVPMRLYLLYLMFTITPTISIYIFEHTLSILFKNQAVPFFAGIIGTFIGLFSMFLPQYPILRKLFLWGYYGALQFVGLYGWTKETRYENAYFSVLEIDWIAFFVLIAASILMYVTGRYLFCKKEI